MEYFSQTSHGGPRGTGYHIRFYSCSSSCINSCVCDIYVGIWFTIPRDLPCSIWNRKQSPGWARGFSIGAGAFAIAISFLVMASPFAGAVFVSVFLGIALLIIGIEIIAVGETGRRMHMMPSMGRYR